MHLWKNNSCIQPIPNISMRASHDISSVVVQTLIIETILDFGLALYQSDSLLILIQCQIQSQAFKLFWCE
jgi:hypothetical protein